MFKHHPLIFTAALFVAFCVITACASLGVPAPQTFNQRAAAATAAVNTVSQTTLTLLQARKITPDESDSYTNRAEEAQQAIDLAVNIYANNPTEAEDRLSAVIAALAILSTELETRK